MTPIKFASEMGSLGVFAGAVLAFEGIWLWRSPLLFAGAVILGSSLVLAGRALQKHKAWGRTVLEVAAWMVLVLGVIVVGTYLSAELSFDPTESEEMQEAGRFGVVMATFGLLAWIAALTWVIRGLRRRDLRSMLHA
jgi:hypothetical protein